MEGKISKNQLGTKVWGLINCERKCLKLYGFSKQKTADKLQLIFQYKISKSFTSKGFLKLGNKWATPKIK
jgi:hypothetical protein